MLVLSFVWPDDIDATWMAGLSYVWSTVRPTSLGSFRTYPAHHPHHRLHRDGGMEAMQTLACLCVELTSISR